MESSLYLEIFQEGEAKGRAEGRADSEANLLIRLLAMRLGRVAPEVRQTIVAQAQTNPEVTSLWFDEVAAADTTEAALRVVRKITAV